MYTLSEGARPRQGLTRPRANHANGMATYLRFIKTYPEYHVCLLDSGELLNPSLKLSCNLSDLMFFPVTLDVRCYQVLLLIHFLIRGNMYRFIYVPGID